MTTYTVTYRVYKNGLVLTDVTLIVDHLPFLGMVVEIPDGSGRYGEVMSLQRNR